nr:hypothetical protein [Tanacetum cinerariifolium]
DGEFCQRCTCMRCGSGLSKGLCLICKNNQNFLNDSPSISENSSQSPPHINHHCCYECGDPLDGIFCKQCTCKSCGKGAYTGYNYPPKVSFISNSEPCKSRTIDELPQTLPSFHPTFYSGDESPLTCDSTRNIVDYSPNVFNPPPQPPKYRMSFLGTMLISVTIVHLKFRLPMIRSRGTIKTLISHKIHKIFNNNIFVVPVLGARMRIFNKIDYLLDELAGELILLKSIPLGIDKADYDPEEEIRLVEKLFDPLIEEIDLFLASDGSIPPGIDSAYSDSEGVNIFLERLLHDDCIPLPDTLDFSNVVQVFLPLFT